MTEGTREEDRATLGRGRRFEAKMLLCKLTMEGNPRKSVASCHSHETVICLRNWVGMSPGCVW